MHVWSGGSRTHDPIKRRSCCLTTGKRKPCHLDELQTYQIDLVVEFMATTSVKLQLGELLHCAN